MQNSTKKLKKSEIQLFNREKMLTIFGWNFEIEERCKGVHCVDLGESFPTSIYLQKSASIQPRTSPSKFGGNYSILFNRVLSPGQDCWRTRAALTRGGWSFFRATDSYLQWCTWSSDSSSVRMWGRLLLSRNVDADAVVDRALRATHLCRM